MTAHRIADDGTLASVAADGPAKNIQHYGPSRFTNGMLCRWSMGPAFDRVDVRAEMRGGSLIFPGSGSINGEVNSKWIKEDNSIVDWTPDWTTSDYCKYWDRRNEYTLITLRATFLKVLQSAAPYWIGNVQSSVQYNTTGANGQTTESLTGIIWLNSASGDFSVAAFAGEVGEASVLVTGWT